jgi:hypothetical protein
MLRALETKKRERERERTKKKSKGINEKEREGKKMYRHVRGYIKPSDARQFSLGHLSSHYCDTNERARASSNGEISKMLSRARQMRVNREASRACLPFVFIH